MFPLITQEGSTMIVVTGATGELGGRIVGALLNRMPAGQIGVSVRDAAKAAGLAAKGVRVIAADFTEPASLALAFEGAEAVLVISASIRGAAAAEANRAAIDAALAAGASRILYTSHQAASASSHFPPARIHAATEDHLASLGIPFTALRHGFYASALSYLLAGALEAGAIYAPADGPVSWTSHDDLAEADAGALLGELSPHEGRTPPLAAPESFDLAAIAALMTDITGRPVERVVMDDEEWLSAALKRGMPEAAAQFALTQFVAARSGEFDAKGSILEEALGRAATPMRAMLEKLMAPA
jgi:uncharacterized protein YbjT (DUF2867 family)